MQVWLFQKHLEINSFDMNIHLINPYGTLPNEGWRKYRTNIAAEQLANAGHNVTLWISNIDHRSKKKRSELLKEVIIKENYKIQIVPSTSYSRNGSIGRIIYEKKFAKNVRNIFLNNSIAADCIIITDPCVFYGDIIYSLARKTNSKFVIDILDIWPEVFSTLLPKPIQTISHFIFKPFYLKRQQLYQKADGIIAVTNDYLQNALKYTKKKHTEVVYIGIDINDIKKEDSSESFKDLIKNKNEKWIIYAGTLGINYDIKSILSLALKMENESQNYKILIAGDGPMKDTVIEFIRKHKLKNTKYLGRLNVDDLNHIYSLSDLALSTYLKTSTVSMPVKAFDNFAFGLPVLNSLEREFGDIVKSENVGLQYEAENVLDIFEKINYILSSPELLENMRANAVNLSKKYSIKNQYHKYITFVEDLFS